MLAAGDHASVRIVKQHHPDIRYDVVVLADDGNHILVTGLRGLRHA